MLLVKVDDVELQWQPQVGGGQADGSFLGFVFQLCSSLPPPPSTVRSSDLSLKVGISLLFLGWKHLLKQSNMLDIRL